MWSLTYWHLLLVSVIELFCEIYIVKYKCFAVYLSIVKLSIVYFPPVCRQTEQEDPSSHSVSNRANEAEMETIKCLRGDVHVLSS